MGRVKNNADTTDLRERGCLPSNRLPLSVPHVTALMLLQDCTGTLMHCQWLGFLFIRCALAALSIAGVPLHQVRDSSTVSCWDSSSSGALQEHCQLLEFLFIRCAIAALSVAGVPYNIRTSTISGWGSFSSAASASGCKK